MRVLRRYPGGGEKHRVGSDSGGSAAALLFQRVRRAARVAGRETAAIRAVARGPERGRAVRRARHHVRRRTELRHRARQRTHGAAVPTTGGRAPSEEAAQRRCVRAAVQRGRYAGGDDGRGVQEGDGRVDVEGAVGGVHRVMTDTNADIFFYVHFTFVSSVVVLLLAVV